MAVTDAWSAWSATAASNSPAGAATPEIDDELRNVKAQCKANLLALGDAQTITAAKTFNTGTLKIQATAAGHLVNTDAGVVSTVPWQCCRAYRDTTQEVVGATTTKILLNADSYDPAGISDLNNNRIIPTQAGYYVVNGNVTITSLAADDTLIVSIHKNGGEAANGNNTWNGRVAACRVAVTVSDVIYMNGTTDYLELKAYVGTTCYTEDAESMNFLSIAGPF